MSVREYVGARYVPLFADPLTWDATRTYEPLTVVLYQGNSYTSRQAVPANIDITNTTYWAQTGNYNAQVEQYRAEVQTFDGRIDTLEDELPSSDFDSTNTVKKYVDDSVEEVAEVIPSTDFDSTNTVKKYVDEAQFENAPIASATVSPFFLGALAEQTPNTEGHAGCIADNGLYQVMISCVSGQQDNTGIAHFINISSNNSKYLPNKQIICGHANSMCWYPENNVFIIAPEFSYSGGVETQWKELLLYSSDFNTLNRAQTPSQNSSIQSVSYDHVTHKLYALGIDNKVYEVSQTYEFTEIGTIDRATYYNQDFAVHDNVYYASSPAGYMKYGDIRTSEILGYMTVNSLSNDMYMVLGELDGMEFDSEGRLLAVGDMSIIPGISTVGYTYTIFQIPLKNSKLYLPQTSPKEPNSTANPYGLTLSPTTFNLRGVTIQHPNILAIYSKLLTNLVLSIGENVSYDRMVLPPFPTVVLQLSNGAIISVDRLIFGYALRCVGSGTISISTSFYTNHRAPHIITETGISLTSPTSGKNVFELCVIGTMYTNGGTAQPNITFPNNVSVGTYRTYMFSRPIEFGIAS